MAPQLLVLPQFLSVVFKRFAWGQRAERSRKLTNPICVTDSISLDAYMAPGARSGDAVYDLVSITEHRGPQLGEGHYVVIARDVDATLGAARAGANAHGGAHRGGESASPVVWREFNDDRVTDPTAPPFMSEADIAARMSASMASGRAAAAASRSTKGTTLCLRWRAHTIRIRLLNGLCVFLAYPFRCARPGKLSADEIQMAIAIKASLESEIGVDGVKIIEDTRAMAEDEAEELSASTNSLGTLPHIRFDLHSHVVRTRIARTQTVSPIFLTRALSAYDGFMRRNDRLSSVLHAALRAPRQGPAELERRQRLGIVIARRRRDRIMRRSNVVGAPIDSCARERVWRSHATARSLRSCHSIRRAVHHRVRRISGTCIS
jgi:hypothetical protein